MVWNERTGIAPINQRPRGLEGQDRQHREHTWHLKEEMFLVENMAEVIVIVELL